MPSPIAIEANSLRKEYGAKVAVHGLDLAVARGEAFGFLGPNGAGKTTTLKMLLGLVRPTAGSGAILGVPITSPRCRHRVGYLPEHFRFHEWLLGAEFLDLHARMHGVARSRRTERIPQLLSQVGLSAAADRRLGAYSKGMLQRIGLAQAIVHGPKVVFLDEPTSGLDPAGRRMVRDLIRQLCDVGATVFLNSHLLSEVEVTCNRVAFVAEGVVRQVVDLEQHRGHIVRVEFRVDDADEALLAGLRRWSAEVSWQRERQTLTLQLADEATIPEINRYLVEQQRRVYSIAPRALSLEELFLQIVGEELCETS